MNLRAGLGLLMGMLLGAGYVALSAPQMATTEPATRMAATGPATVPATQAGRRGRGQGGGFNGGGFANQDPSVGVHDPSIIKQRDWYYVFSTNNGIQVRRSKDLVKWTRLANVFAQLPAWCGQEIPGARGLWAPDISFAKNANEGKGEYRLYYALSTFGTNRSCIGLATNVTLDPADPQFKWVDKGKVLESNRTDNFNAIDPNVVVDADGTAWLDFGSFWTGIKMRQLDATGMTSKTNTTLYALAQRTRPTAIEAPFIILRDGYYYLFVSFDKCCVGVNSTYKIMVGRSQKVTGPYVDRDGKAMTEGAATLVEDSSGNVRGPGGESLLKDGDRWLLVHHFYDAANRGQPTIQIRPLTWDEKGFPVAGKPVGS